MQRSPSRQRLNTRSRFGLKTTLVGAILLIVSATATVVYIPWWLMSQRNIKTIVNQVNKEIIQGTSQEVERLFASNESAHQLILSSINRNLLTLDRAEERENYLISVLEANPNFTWVQFGYSNGDFIGAQRTTDGLIKYHNRDWNPETQKTVATIRTYQNDEGNLELLDQEIAERNPPYYAPDRPWYQNAVEKQGETAWTIYIYSSSSTPGMDSSVVLERDGEVLGVIGVGMELTQLSEYLSRLQGDRAGEIFIINAQEELIAASNPAAVLPEAGMETNMQQFNNTDDLMLQLAYQGFQTENITNQLVNELEKGESQKFVYADPDSGEKYLISFAPIGRNNWILGTIIPSDSYLATIRRNQQILLVAILFFIIGAAGIAILISDRLIARPILKIANMATDIETGQFEVHQLAEVAERQDELGRLARVFQTMAQQVYEREYKMRQQIEELGFKADQAELQQLNLDQVDSYQQLLIKSRRLRGSLQQKR
ncbi:MAG: cache domain-containing protein [Thainema sp.]